MLNRLAFAAAMTVLISAPQLVVADPITYDFIGTLSQPADGVTTFSGSLTFNAIPTGADVSPGGAYVTEAGSEVSLSLNLGGQVFDFQNNALYSPATLFLEKLPGPYDESAQPSVLFSVFTSSSQFGFWMKFVSPATNIPTNLATLSLPPSTSSVDIVTNNPGQGYVQSQGVISSIELVPSVPEPGTLAIFAALGVSAMWRTRRSRGCESWIDRVEWGARALRLHAPIPPHSPVHRAAPDGRRGDHRQRARDHVAA